VEATIRSVDPNVSFKAVHASRGKVTRAEPISALYEQNKVHHVGTFTALEDQLCAFTSDFSRSTAGYSPDRLDALVWALSELMVGEAQSTFLFGSVSTRNYSPSRSTSRPNSGSVGFFF
jgi:phage terminase large subunit-like protein